MPDAFDSQGPGILESMDYALCLLCPSCLRAETLAGIPIPSDYFNYKYAICATTHPAPIVVRLPMTLVNEAADALAVQG